MKNNLVKWLPFNWDIKNYINNILIYESSKEQKAKCLNELKYIIKLYHDDINFYGINYFENSYFSKLFFILKYRFNRI